MHNTPEWYDSFSDSFTGIFSAMTLAGALTSCAWLLVSL
jgi:hypothetical protein